MIALLLFWNVAPYAAMAGTFITPGDAITPGKTFKPGKPIEGGQFIIPGQVYNPGNPLKPGETGGASGAPIIPQAPNSLGLFIIPNVPPPPPGSFYWEFIGIEGGSPLTGGSPMQGGEGLNGGDAAKGGDPAKGGEGLKGGDPAKGGEGLKEGDPAEGGEGLKGGDSAKGGDPTKGGESLEGGDPSNAGEGINGGDPTKGGENPDGGKTPNGGENPTGGGGGDDNPTPLEIFIKTTDDERGWFSHVTGFFDDYKTYGLGFFLDKNVLGATLSITSGFKVIKTENGKGYKVKGSKNSNVKWLDHLYQQYKGYVVDGGDRALGPQTKYIKNKTYDAFNSSKGLKLIDQSKRSFIWDNFKTNMSENWNPFSKSFRSLGTMAKMNGPLNYLMATAGSIWDYSPKGKFKDVGFGSSDFMADVSTELAIGIGSTAIGSIASSAATGALAGSVFPGVGTVAGAAAGLIVGLGTTYLINGTSWGRAGKDALKNGFKTAYSGIANSKVGKGTGKIFKGIGKGLGELFGG